MSSEFCPSDTTSHLAPPSVVNSSDVNVLSSPCFVSEKEICKIASLPAECGTQVSPPSSVVIKRPPVPAAYPNLSFAKPIFSSTAPSTVMCFVCQCCPESGDTAMASSVPHIQIAEPWLVTFSTRKGRFCACHSDAGLSSAPMSTTIGKMTNESTTMNGSRQLTLFFIGGTHHIVPQGNIVMSFKVEEECP
jgi:hypothetical protein